MSRSAHPQYLDEFKAVWEYVDAQWKSCGKRILGQRGFHAVEALSVKLSHAPLPIFLYLLAGCVMCSNGATVTLWGSAAPISFWFINCNYSQTRKSGLTKLAETVAQVVDQRIMRTVQLLLDAKRAIQRLTQPTESSSNVRLPERKEHRARASASRT